MEYAGLILPMTKNICRTCLMESESSMYNVQDLIEHDTNKIKLIDILVFLNCLENNDEENWPQGICSTCVATALVAYNFKLNCLKANSVLSRILMVQSPTNFQRTDIDSIDINVVYQDHEYDVPLFSNQPLPNLDFETTLPQNKELTPLPPVTEITSTEQPPRKVGEKKYSCKLCPKSYTRVFGLRDHMTKHANIKRYLCFKCGKRFFTLSGAKQHLLTHKDMAKFKCGFCNKTYKWKQSLKEHFRMAHSTICKLFVCTICNKKFTAKSTLSMHIKQHNGEKFPCPDCPKTFTRMSYLKTHSIVHSGQARPCPYACTYRNCKRSFSTKHSLKVHIAYIHSPERPYKCEICYHGFPTASALKLHRKSHARKDVSCNTCGMILANKRALQKHVKTHDVEPKDMVLVETVVDNGKLEQVC